MKRLLVLGTALSLMGAGCFGYEIAPVKTETPAAPPAATSSAQTAPTTPKTTTPVKTPAKTPAKTPTPAPAPTTTTFTSAGLQVSVLVASYGADLSWTMYQGNDLNGYALVKSTTDPNPYYPKEFWFHFENAVVNARAYQDRSLEKGKTTYYRVCAIRTDNTIVCGNVAKAVF